MGQRSGQLEWFPADFPFRNQSIVFSSSLHHHEVKLWPCWLLATAEAATHALHLTLGQNA
jgi:integral membrane sensor domain MASE1